MASGGRSNAVSLQLHDDALSRLSWFGLEVGRPFRALLQRVMNPV